MQILLLNCNRITCQIDMCSDLRLLKFCDHILAIITIIQLVASGSLAIVMDPNMLFCWFYS